MSFGSLSNCSIEFGKTSNAESNGTVAALYGIKWHSLQTRLQTTKRCFRRHSAFYSIIFKEMLTVSLKTDFTAFVHNSTFSQVGISYYLAE